MSKPFEIKPNILDRAIGFVSPAAGARRMLARTRLALASEYYRGSSSDRLRSDWGMGWLKRTTPPKYELDILRGRSRDLARNDPVASGAIETIGANVIGAGLRPQSRIRADRLGVAPDVAAGYQAQAEAIWESWCHTADSANKLDFAEMQFLAFRRVVEDGEILALPIMVDEPWRPVKRAVQLIEGDRLVSTDATFCQGIRFGDRGEPLEYSFELADPKQPDGAGFTVGKYDLVAARDSMGRPKVLHVFPSKRVGQVRGVPHFAPVLSYFKDLSDYLEAEVVAARVAACLAVFITMNDTSAFPMGGGTATDASGKRIQDLEPGMVSYLKQGESIGVVEPKRPGSQFAPFVEGVLRLIGVSLGLPYELLLKDFSKTNYSSARASLLEGRRHFTNWRRWFAAQFCQPIYELVLEEAWLRGLFDAPKFYEFREEYCRAQWIGAGYGWVDPGKEIEASQMAIDYALSTLAEEAAGQGRDWEEVLEQRKREQDRIGELGVKVGRAVPAGPEVPAAKVDDKEDDDEDKDV